MPFQQLCNAGLPIPAPREIFVKLGLRSLSHCHSKLIFDGGFDAQAETKAGVRRDRLPQPRRRTMASFRRFQK
jgi:hypothetical protein